MEISSKLNSAFLICPWSNIDLQSLQQSRASLPLHNANLEGRLAWERGQKREGGGNLQTYSRFPDGEHTTSRTSVCAMIK